MSIVDIYCHNCFSSAWINYPTTQNQYHLFIGQMEDIQLYSCLYFNLPPIENLGNIQSAKLILFNAPLSPFDTPTYNHSCLSSYLLYPLLEYHTVYSYLTLPSLDYTHGIYFYGAPNTISTEIDITELVRNWLLGKIANKGLIMLGCCPNNLVAFGSCYSGYSSLLPFLRITYLPVTSSTCHLAEVGTSLDWTAHSRIYLN